MDKKENISFNGNGNVATIQEWSPVDEGGRHKNTVEIEQDIEETRHTMDLILDSLSGKTSPGALYNRAQSYLQNASNRETVKKTVSNVSKSVSNSFQKNPLPVMMIAAGASWMFWETQHQGQEPSHDGKRGERMKSEANEQMQRMRGETGERLETAKGKAGEFSESARSKAGEMASTAREKAESFLGQAHQRGDEYREKATEAQARAKYSYKKADTAVHNNPLLFGVAAAFAGIVAGLMLPETKTESRYAGEKSGEMLQKAKETGKEIAREAGQATSNKAKEEGISPEQLSQKAKATLQETGEATSNKVKEEGRVTTEHVSRKTEEIVRDSGPAPKKTEPVTPADIGTRTVENVKTTNQKPDQKSL